MVRPAWLLARVSTTKAEQEVSPENQLATLREYYARAGRPVAGWGIEKMTGATLERPELRKAMDLARAGKIGSIGLTDLERLGRNVKEMLAHADELSRLGVELVFARLGDQSMVDTTTPMGRMVFTMFAAFAEFYRGHYRQKSMEGQQRARERGRRVGRQPEYLTPQTLGAVRKLRERLGPLATWRRLSEELARQGILQPSRYLKKKRVMRPARAWPPGTLQALIGRAEKAEREPS